MVKSFKSLLESIYEAKEDELEKAPVASTEGDDVEGDEEEKEEKISDHAPDGKGHYTADDLREIIDYVRDLLEKELKDNDDEEDEDGKKKDSDDIGEIGLDLIYEYADLLPETVINQIVDDLKDMFEIEDTMLESIVTEGSAFFLKSNKGPAAKAAIKKMREFYRKNKSKILSRNRKWRSSEVGKKMADLHKKIFSGMGKVKGKRVVRTDGF